MALPNVQDYFVPGTRQEAVDLLGKFGENAMLVAGGTFVHGLEVRGVLGEIEALIDISQLELAGIRSEAAAGDRRDDQFRRDPGATRHCVEHRSTPRFSMR